MERSGRLRRRLLLLALGGIVLAAASGALFGKRGYLQLRRYERERQALEQEIETLRKEIRRLNREIYAFRDDPMAIERVAREDLILARPGEVLFLFPADESDVPGTASP